MLDTLKKSLEGVFIDVESVNKHDKEETIKANTRLNEIERNANIEMSQAYREGFVQGWIEKSWKERNA